MNKKFIITIVSLIIFIFCINLIYKKYLKSKPQLPYKIEKAKKRNIYQIIDATGRLEIKDNLKIGSLIAGTVKKIYVKENEKVQKDQLLAIIDDGKNNTVVKRAEGEHLNGLAELEYQKNYFNRQEKLFLNKQISTNFFEQVKRDYKKAKANLKITKANLKQSKIEYENKKIKTPDKGIIVAIGITEGERVTTDLDATTLFIIAKNITEMEAELDIDESDIGKIKNNLSVDLNVSAYPDKTFNGKITQISYSSKITNNVSSYKATVSVQNKDLLLKPGMSINAKINVAESLKSISITTQAFQINPKLIKKTAKIINYKFQPINEEQKKILNKKQKKDEIIKYVWIVKDESFIEKKVNVGITDDNYFVVKSGITENDDIVIDLEETDSMEKFYKKWFSGAF